MPPKKTVLLIEDDAKVQDEIQRALEVDAEFSFDVSSAKTLEEAIGLAQKQKKGFDVVIFDMRLKDKPEGGLEALEVIKHNFPRVKLIYTAHATFPNCVNAMKAGADDYIDKTQPNSLKILITTIKENLKRRKFDDHEPDNDYVNQYADEWAENYRGEMLAFIDGKLVAHARSEKELKENVLKSHPSETPYIMFAPVRIR